MKKLLGITAAAIFAATLAGCDNQGPAERAGESIDDAASDIRDNASDAGDSVSDTASDVGDSASDALDDARDN